LEPRNHSLQAYLPEQVSVSDGKLAILSENTPANRLPYRSGQVISRHAQRFGRWEVRAKIPGTRGIYPAIRLVPDAPWPRQGEIGIMESRGDRPTITSSTFHWGSSAPFSHGVRAIEQRSSLAGNLVSFPDDFHTYAVEWLDDQLRFYVDDVYHTIFYSDEVGDFLPRLQLPMRLVIETAVGGDSLSPPDASTAWPQRFLVDWVRVYEPTGRRGDRRFVNGDFEANGGTLAGWHVFGNRMEGEPNVLAHNGASLSGRTSLRLSGQSSGGENYSGVSQGIGVVDGQRLRARLSALVPSISSLAKTSSRATMKIEFYNNWGDYFGGPAMLGAEECTVADGSTPTDQWQEQELIADVPEGACEARFSIVFAQQLDGPGAVYCDAVEFAPIGK
jgi:beta-glucanase (GH16 family)